MLIRASLCEESIVDTPMHQHSHNEIIVNIKGHGILTVDDQDYQLEPGTVACIPGNMRHRDFSAGARLSGTINFEPSDKATIRQVCVFYDRSGFFQKLLEIAIEVMNKEDPISSSLRNAIGDAVLALLQLRGVTTIAATNDIVDLLDQNIRAHVTDPGYDVMAAMKRTGYSPNHFRELYKKSFGCTPQNQLTHLRVEYAKAQMRLNKDRVSIAEVAQKSGFLDAVSFSKTFKRVEGISPMEYRSRCIRRQNAT